MPQMRPPALHNKIPRPGRSTAPAVAAAGRMLPPPGARRVPDFSLATVNIVLLLVLFFLVAGTIVDQTEQGIELPDTTDLPLSDLPRPLIVLAADGGTSLDGVVKSAPEIAAHLTDAAAVQVYLLTARDTPARALLDLLAVMEPAGIATSLVTLRNRAPRPVALATSLPQAEVAP